MPPATSEQILKNRFKTEVMKVFDVSPYAHEDRAQVQREIDLIWNAMDKLPSRVIVRTYRLKGARKLDVQGRRFFLLSGKSEIVWLGMVNALPSWGWKSLHGTKDLGLKTEFADEVLEWFMLSCSIHITRCAYTIASLLMWRTTGEILNRFGPGQESGWYIDGVTSQKRASETPGHFARESALHNLHEIFKGHRNRKARRVRLDAYALALDDLVNVEDLDLHRAAFHLIHAASLQCEFGLSREAIVALCASVDACRVLLERAGIETNTEGLCYRVGLPFNLAEELARMEDARNRFCAHRAAASWWDIDEIFEEQVKIWLNTTWRLFKRVCKWEQHNRVVPSMPKNWGQWWRANAVQLWKCLGYEEGITPFHNHFQ